MFSFQYLRNLLEVCLISNILMPLTEYSGGENDNSGCYPASFIPMPSCIGIGEACCRWQSEPFQAISCDLNWHLKCAAIFMAIRRDSVCPPHIVPDGLPLLFASDRFFAYRLIPLRIMVKPSCRSAPSFNIDIGRRFHISNDVMCVFNSIRM